MSKKHQTKTEHDEKLETHDKTEPRKKRPRSVIGKIILVFIVIIVLLVTIEVVRLLLLKRSVTTYRQYWQSRLQERPADNALTYVALGDSAAQGLGASSPEKGYVGLISDALAAKYNRPVHVINLSVSGALVSDVTKVQLPNLGSLVYSSDTVITLAIGGNDVNQQIDEKTFTANLETLLSQLPKQTVVATTPYFGGGRARSREPIAERDARIIQTVADKYGLTVAPLYEITKAGDNPFIYGADFFHPNNRGYKNWFKAFWLKLS